MALVPGTRLGPYEILSPLGAGGMGEVYRARDTKLDRDVALKVLPAHLSTDSQAHARFENEAKAVAALSHPGILAIHDYGRIDGVSFAVTELLDGETLGCALRRGPLAPRKALDVATQLAEALSAAHEKGIVHRDVKPENVFLTRGGHAKLLDFGLAHTDATGPGAAGSHSPTAADLTTPGYLVGTVSYMSPEQAQGLPATSRSDQFSLGILLYEMLSGRRPFQGETAPEILTAILRAEPEPLDRLAPSTPAPVLLTVERLLSKDPEERFDSTRDLARDLAAWAKASPASSGALPVVRSARRSKATAWTRPVGAATALGAGALLVAVAAYRVGERAGPSAVPAPPAFDRFERLTSQPGAETDPALSPDGGTLAFAMSGDVWVQRVGGRNATNLTGDHSGFDGEPAWSPDGRQIAFRSERDGGGVYMMGATGESVRRVSAWGRSPDWYPDGRRLVVTSCVGAPYSVDPAEAELRSVDLATGALRTLARVFAFNPRVSPSGRRVAYCATRPGDFRRDIYTVPANASEKPEAPVPVTQDVAVDWSPFWSADGRFLYFASDRSGTMNLWCVAIDEATGRATGPPQPVPVPARAASRYSIARTGDRIAFTSDESVSTIERFPFDPKAEAVRGPAQIVYRSSTGIGNLRISPRGDLLAFNSFGRSDLWVVRTDGGGLRQLTDDPARDYFPSFSPDGQRLAFQSDRDGAIGVWTIGVDGSATACVATGPEKPGWPTWSPDGKSIAVDTASGLRLLRADASRDAALPPPLPKRGDGRRFLPDAWTKDARVLSGLLVRADGVRLGVATLDLDRMAYAVVSEAGGRSAFLSDGRRLLFAEDGAIVLVDTATGRRKSLVAADSGRKAFFPAVAPDDRDLFVLRTDVQSDIWLASRSGAHP